MNNTELAIHKININFRDLTLHYVCSLNNYKNEGKTSTYVAPHPASSSGQPSSLSLSLSFSLPSSPLSPEVIIVEAIFLIPETVLLPSDAVHGVNDEDKVFEELRSHVFIDPVMVDS